VSRSLRTKALFLFYYTKGFGHNQKQFWPKIFFTGTDGGGGSSCSKRI
jgi:hypothetical protein